MTWTATVGEATVTDGVTSIPVVISDGQPGGTLTIQISAANALSVLWAADPGSDLQPGIAGAWSMT